MLLTKRCLLILSLLIFQLSQAQEKGIQFDKNSSLKEIFARAKQENKFVFIDCYTTWCGPCKFMDQVIFIDHTVGKFYNANFINARFQIDTTKGDLPDIKNRYADASYINHFYHINGYPTFLYFNTNGELVHRELGSCTTDMFIDRGKHSMSPETQYYTQLKKYYSGERNPSFLKNLTLLALHAYDDSVTPVVSKLYLSSLGNTLTANDYKFINEVTNRASDTGFTIMLHHIKDFESAVGAKAFHEHLINLIVSNEAKTHFGFENWNEERWSNYSKELTAKYPDLSEEVLFNIKSYSYQKDEKWKDLIKLVDNYRSTHTINNQILNNFAWTIFIRCTDAICLNKALEWSKYSFTNQTPIEPTYMDTYANILYKLGKKKEALEWEKKAQWIAISQGAPNTWAQDVIDKMNKGEKTWE